MGWQNRSNDDLEWVQLDENETFEGTLLGTIQCDGTNGPFTAYKLQSESGNLYGFSGASIQNQLGGESAGTRVRITFDGMKTAKSGRNFKAYSVQVYVDVDAPAPAAPVADTAESPVDEAPAAPKPARSF